MVDGVEDEEDEEGALEGGHDPEQAAGGGDEEAGGPGDEDTDLVHPVTVYIRVLWLSVYMARSAAVSEAAAAAAAPIGPTGRIYTHHPYLYE